MKTLKDLFKYLNENNISYYLSKKPGIVCINGKYKKIIEKVSEVNKRNMQVWESCHSNKWTTFLKNTYNPNKDEFEDGYDMDNKHWEMDAYDYDGDPDEFDNWRDDNGY